MPEQPNFLLILTDHWAASRLGVAGHPTIRTPTLDQLAANGVRYTHAYSESPVCIPARRTLMTGVRPRTHGDRVFKPKLPMPDVPSLAQTFRDAGYQAYAVGKLHVYPIRSRIGFDDVILSEEGRIQFGVIDDYELYLGDHGYPGQAFAHGLSPNEYYYRPWHLPEEFHVTNWATQQMVRMIKRRDPTRPSFWYLSYVHPHPPLVPLSGYLDIYRDVDPVSPYRGAWANESEQLPYHLQAVQENWGQLDSHQVAWAQRAVYALCTHIDHQLRVLLGSLREEGLLENTVILFSSDHGDMLGNHGLKNGALFYESAANIPLILVDGGGDPRLGHHRIDDRLVGLQDVMPTLLDLAGIKIPASVEGLSMVGRTKRPYLYGEMREGIKATRMIHDGRYKLIYYVAGNRRQLFDLANDPQELQDLSSSPTHAEVLERLNGLLIEELYGPDEEWLADGQLVGLPDQEVENQPDTTYSYQRGNHWPPPDRDWTGF